MIHEVKVPLAWQWIEKVRETVNDVLRAHPEELRQDAVMVASELAENLVKYGQAMGGEDSGRIAIETNDGFVSITSENGATPEGAQKVQELVNAMTAAENVQMLYLERLTQMADIPGDSASELGLLRIAFEGGFSLTCEYAAPRLRLTAKRSLSG